MNNSNHNKSNNQYKLNLFSTKLDDDWTYAIHQELNIRRRTCTTFIPKTPSTNDHISRSDIRCGCNRLHREHSWDVINGDELVWNKKKHTTSACNNAYGFIPNSRTHYIRCDIETQPNILAKLMFDVWKVKFPRLIMCIIGGAKYFKLNERLEREFIKGIIQAALKADGWIVTTGFRTGVVQLVGEAIHDHKVTNPRSHITAIGCSKWGATRNREALILKKPSINHNFDISINKLKNDKGQQDLEPNHTHFLLLDDGTYFGYEMGDYRTRFVTEVSKCKDANVPIVTIVVEGGPDTLSAIYNDLRVGIPVVLVDGSGRIPNLLANFLTRTETMINRNEKTDENFTNWKEIVDIQDSEKLRNLFRRYEEEIRNGLKAISKGSRTSEKQMDELFNYFLYCLQPAIRNKIQIYSLESNYDLDDTIFEAIIQAKQKKSSETNSELDREQLLQLALAWDAIEIAKEYIVKDDLNDLTSEKKEQLFFEALILDRPQFINTFLKLNFNLPEMFYERQINKPWKLKWNQLAKLYNDNDKKKKERLYLLRKCHGKNQIDSVHELDRVLRTLIGDYMIPIYTHSIVGCLRHWKLCCGCLQTARVSDSRAYLHIDNNDNESEIVDPEEARKEAKELVYRDLFLWSILTNRIEMSKVILNHMETRICALLIGSKILKSYLNFALDNESKDVLRSQADQFEEYANECLKCCYNYDEEKACEIAIRRINIFGGVSCLQVAVDADDKNFVGQPCCDQLLNNIWYDKMEPFQSTTLQRIRLLLSIFTFGLLAPFLVSFRKEQLLQDDFFNEFNRKNELIINEKDNEEEKKEFNLQTYKRLNDYGINYSDIYMWKSNKCSKSYLTYFFHLKYFHESPIVKYLYNCISYIIFLLLFSYYLLFDFQIPKNQNPSIHWTEIFVIIIITTMLIEEIREFFSQDHRSIIGKLTNYFITNQFFNLIRVTSYLLFYIGLILRFINTDNEETFSAAKIVLAYDLEIWFIRSLSFLGIAQKMGPKLVMIRRMTIDLFFFTYIILIAIIAYGVASRTMYNYNNDILSFDARSIFRHIIYPAYYLLYGNVGDELSELDANPDSSMSISTHVLLAFHMLFVNILLINLLIAMFSYTFESVQTHTDLVWRYERYLLIRTYFDQPPLFPPLTIITHIIEFIKLIYRYLLNHRNKTETKIFKIIGANRKIDKDWSEFESYATNHYAQSLITNQKLSTSILLSSKVRQEQQSFSDITNLNSRVQSNTNHIDMKTIIDELVSLRKAVLDLRTYSEEMNRYMQWMMDAMERVKMSKEPKPKLKSAITTDNIKLIDN
ncbi:unnamed protein product [Rotaria sordida]|uniref:Uncharacterized protein n=1 Tax=Rotaria sordida TaxID=392033 RepID=A0A815F3F1_9BILA|nr:unnamed protein product [Rotaria sordida]CAF1320547.1 unnamed protein product [Rotaria sordida]